MDEKYGHDFKRDSFDQNIFDIGPPILPTVTPFKPEFTIVIFIHCKPRIAVAILDLNWMKMI